MECLIEVKESYRDYIPPIDVKKTVQTLLRYVPDKYLSGINCVVLTNSGKLSRHERREKTRSRHREVHINECNGLYHQQYEGNPAWIEIFVDNIFLSIPVLMLRIPLIRNLIMTDVLYHEIGHHIHKTMAPEHVEREDSAEKWRSRLGHKFVFRRYWYLLPLLLILAAIAKVLKNTFFSKK